MPTRKNTPPAADRLLPLYRTMRLVRQVEQALSKLFADGEVPGFIHLSIGQEAIAAGVASALQAQDSLATTHRGHGHVLARGMALEGFFKEIMGRAGGLCQGRGGSMHVADLSLGILGANGIVGAGIPIALGSAVAHQVRQHRRRGGGLLRRRRDGRGRAAREPQPGRAVEAAAAVRLREQRLVGVLAHARRQFAAQAAKLAGAFGIRYDGRRRQRRAGRRRRRARASPRTARRGGRACWSARPTACAATSRAIRRSTGRPTNWPPPPSATRLARARAALLRAGTKATPSRSLIDAEEVARAHRRRHGRGTRRQAAVLRGGNRRCLHPRSCRMSATEMRYVQAVAQATARQPAGRRQRGAARRGHRRMLAARSRPRAACSSLSGRSACATRRSPRPRSCRRQSARRSAASSPWSRSCSWTS
jgi:hypothetical protein